MPSHFRALVGASVLEVIADHDGDTYRAVYPVKFQGVVYVLHVFQKKSHKRIGTPRHEIDLIKPRLKKAVDDYAEEQRRIVNGR
jgi:phage-related protein